MRGEGRRPQNDSPSVARQDSMGRAGSLPWCAHPCARARARAKLTPMDADIARSIAETGYLERRNRFGERLIDHARRVADAVPSPARPVAWLHDILELPETDPGALCDWGLSPVELAALEL